MNVVPGQGLNIWNLLQWLYRRRIRWWNQVLQWIMLKGISYKVKKEFLFKISLLLVIYQQVLRNK